MSIFYGKIGSIKKVSWIVEDFHPAQKSGNRRSGIILNIVTTFSDISFTLMDLIIHYLLHWRSSNISSHFCELIDRRVTHKYFYRLVLFSEADDALFSSLFILNHVPLHALTFFSFLWKEIESGSFCFWFITCVWWILLTVGN